MLRLYEHVVAGGLNWLQAAAVAAVGTHYTVQCTTTSTAPPHTARCRELAENRGLVLQCNGEKRGRPLLPAIHASPTLPGFVGIEDHFTGITTCHFPATRQPHHARVAPKLVSQPRHTCRSSSQLGPPLTTHSRQHPNSKMP